MWLVFEYAALARRVLLCITILLLISNSPNTSADPLLLPDRVSDIANTRHNFSATVVPQLPNSVERNVASEIQSDICIFCHTPHAATASQRAPLWNKQLSTAVYTTYDSGSLNATISQPSGSSKLCLSCHDGTIAIGAVNVLDGTATDRDELTDDIGIKINTGGKFMPAGEGASTGFTRNLGIDLSNDHPISFRYDTTLAQADGELRDPQLESTIGDRGIGVQPPLIPLENGEVQCNSCHDPHIRSTDQTENIKFLRLNRLQKIEPANSTFDANNDIICLACHDKQGWIGSAHANEVVANEIYRDNSAALREFPAGTTVWQSACLGCHDSHTVQGARWLLREGSDGALTVNGARQGGNAASEQTCYQCHSNTGGTLLTQGVNTEVPDIRSDYQLAIHMPISNDDDPNGLEKHDIGISGNPDSGKDGIESQLKLGKGNLLNRHAECSDCHNPHRVIRNRLFNANPQTPDAAGTHEHNVPHSNLASGVLRGAWGVEPSFASDAFMSNPITFTVKKGNPPIGALTDKSQPYVTREYQICLKCHSNYAYDISPMLGASTGGTPPGTNGVTQYTNQAMEFNAPLLHKAEFTAPTPSGADISYRTNNHRSWHPVLDNTGRDDLTRRMTNPGSFKAPFDSFVGAQTMYCSDCHGSNSIGESVVPDGGENGRAWGPHGSENDFLLKGKWDHTSGTPCNGTNCALESRNDQQNDLCFKCHTKEAYAFNTNPALRFNSSGFSGVDGENQHLVHVERMGRIKCNWCHVAVPHGWKNKGLLVNINDVGPEGGLPAGTEINLPVINQQQQLYFNGPYYNGAILKVDQFAASGNWQINNCGSRAGLKGQPWMDAACNNLP